MHPASTSPLTGAEKQQRYAARHPGRQQANWRRYAMSEKGTVTLLLNYARDRARRDGLTFDLEREDIHRRVAAGVCEFSGLPIQRVSPGRYRTHPFAPSLDRIDPAKGYVTGNVRLVAFAVNRARSDFGDDVLLLIARAIAHKHGASNV